MIMLITDYFSSVLHAGNVVAGTGKQTIFLDLTDLGLETAFITVLVTT